MDTPAKAHAHETRPVGRTPEDRERNAELLSGYDYDRYAEALTGFTGQDLQRIGFVRWESAVRVRVGPRGNYKAGFARRSDGRLVLAVCRDNNNEDRRQRRFNIFVCESPDEGLTWREIGETPLFGKEPCLASVPDGSLVLMAQGGYFGPGAKLDEHPLSRSEDGGRAWETTGHQSADYPRSFVVEPDGSLLMATAVKPDWHGEGGQV